MAILKLGAIVTAISGKVGGQTFINGSQGTYLKNNGNISKTPTPKQSIQRIKTANLTQTWRSLTSLEQKSWVDQVGNWEYINRVGEKKEYTAYQIFMFVNQGMLTTNQNLIKTAVPSVVMSAYNYSITDNGALTLEVKGTSLDVNSLYVIWCTSKLSPGITNGKAFIRKIAVITEAELSVGYNFAADYADVFGPAVSGDYLQIFVQAIYQTNGQRSPIDSGELFTVS